MNTLKALVLTLTAAVALCGQIAFADEAGQSLLLMNFGAPNAPGDKAAVMDYGLGASRRLCQKCTAELRNPATPQGIEQRIGGVYGIGQYSSVSAHGLLISRPNFESSNAGAMIEATTLLLRPSRADDWSAGISGGWLTSAGVNHARVRLNADKMFGNWNTSTQTLFDKSFRSGQDGVDVMVGLGASYNLTPAVGLGFEYTCEDLEALVDDEEAEGGARHLFGPTVAIRPVASKMRLLVGPAYSSGPQGGSFVGRLGFSIEI